MLERSQESYPLLRQFREFYAQVARLRCIVEADRSGGEAVSPLAVALPSAALPVPAAVAQLPAQAESMATAPAQQSVDTLAWDEDEDATTLRVWQEMARYLDQKMYEVKHAASSLSGSFLGELAYIMAAFADETFICLMDWRGRDYWRDHLMEQRLFRSQVAGQDIFRRIDRLLGRQDYGAEELAAVYLMVLSLGFRGQYFRDPESVDAYRKKLFDRLLMTNPELQRDSCRLFPEAYRHTVTEGAPVRLPEPKKWWLVVAGIVGTWLILSTIAWIMLTRSTRETLAVTVRSLDWITNHQMVSETSNKWRSLPFSLQDGAFRLKLAAPLALNHSSSGISGAVLAPVLIAASGQAGLSAGSAAQVEAWLSLGSTVVPASFDSLASSRKVVASVKQIYTPPSGVTADSSTLFFMVDTAVSVKELALHPQLTFPANDGTGLTVAAVTLYLPEPSTAGAQ